MATELNQPPVPSVPELKDPSAGQDSTTPGMSARMFMRRVLAPLSSLKLTVLLLCLSIFIVLAGTFAQVDNDIWTVINEYFRINASRAFSTTFPYLHPRELFVWIDLDIFFPSSFFPADPSFPNGMQWLEPIWPKDPQLPDSAGFLFPRGWTIGIVMMANLLAAHWLRFKIQAAGSRLWGGVGALSLGILITTFVILSGSNSEGVQGNPWIEYGTLWKVLQFSLLALAAPAIYGAVNTPSEKWGLRVLLSGVAVALFVLGLTSLWKNPAAGESASFVASMRILYQLLKGLLAALVLLIGCVMVFRRRAGVVLLHGGIGLIMAYEVLVGTQHVETRMAILENQEVNYSFDMREAELVFIDRSDLSREHQIAIDDSVLATGKTISDERLPFDIKIEKYMVNSNLARKQSSDQDPEFETKGWIGERFVATDAAQSSGTDMNAQEDAPSAYVRLLGKPADGKGKPTDLGVYLVSTIFDDSLRFSNLPQTVTWQDKEYEIALRYRRYYKPYRVRLDDVQKNDYAGTSNPRDYRAIIDITKQDGAVVLKDFPIWMNNPLRFAGETFYQSDWGMLQGGKEYTVFQVVKNEGWMAPYVGCMIVLVGMLYQFGIGLLRFMDRRRRVAEVAAHQQSLSASEEEPEASGSNKCPLWRIRWGIPLGVGLFVLLLLLGMGWPRKNIVHDFHLAEFGDIPIIAGGRSMPFETLAQVRLMMISDLQGFKPVDEDPTDGKDPKTLPATLWLLDMIARPEVADQHPVFRIENDELAKSLGLEITSHRRYAYADFKDRIDELKEQVDSFKKLPKQSLTVYQRKQMELMKNISSYRDVRNWFSDAGPEVEKNFPALVDPESSPEVKRRMALQVASALLSLAEDSKQFQVPLVAPLHIDASENSLTARFKRDWDAYPIATGFLRLEQALGTDPPPGILKIRAIFEAWKLQDAEAFNESVADYQNFLAQAKPEELKKDTAVVSLSKARFEGYFNRIGPFNLLSFSYLLVFLLTAVGWLLIGFDKETASQVLIRSGMLAGVVMLLIHTLAIVGRIYISGRPPVTNLYSSAVFIGWAAVAGGLIAEGIFRLGIGNMVAALSGFVTLRIAHALMFEGDTLGVLVAVLDTQFWLATHVVCITLGYAATYVAGLFGLIYIFRGSWLAAFTISGMLIAGSVPMFVSGDRESIRYAAILAVAGVGALGFAVQSILNGRHRLLSPEVGRQVARLIYGTVCAATFLSFVGTVLGGLWADDSWGRFWGWDPKENGALIIVLWNALILHARWDGLIRDRGLAVLAVLGNVVTSWSWFGVNELGVGLHTYGFTEGRLLVLLGFCASQLIVAGIGLVPKFQSLREGKNSPPSAAV